MKEWAVGLKLDLGDTQIQCILTVKAADRYDAVAAAIATITSGAKVTAVVESNPRESQV